MTLPPDPVSAATAVEPLSAEEVAKRDDFAKAALIALGGHKAVTNRGIPWLADHAYLVADAMLERRRR